MRPTRRSAACAVQQQGRRKPFDTLAREAVKQIHGAPSVKQTGPAGNTIDAWPAVAALLDWSVRPQFWDDQDIILVPHRPLRQTLADAAGQNMRKLSADQKWLSPNDIEDAVVTVDGKTESFPDWFAAIVSKDQAIRTAQSSGRIKGAAPIAPLSSIEAKVLEVGERLVRYKAFRDKNGRALEGLEIEATPRPANASYLAFTRNALLAAPRFVVETFPLENLDQTARESLQAADLDQRLDAFQVNTLEVFASYIDEVKKKDRYLPGTNPGSDTRYLSWLEDKAAWVPIRFLLDLDLKELERAGYPVALVEAFRTAYHELEASERARPGHASREKAANLVSAARALGTSASKTYPTESALALETHYNRVAPFSWAPWPYGIALVLFLIALGIADVRGHDPRGKLGRSLYAAGIVALVTGIAIECYGFTLRVMISGWAPVTNMYETVIWVALVTSVLGLVLELIYRKTFAALAASGISLLTTVLAATASEQLLDPRIKSLTPVLRSNYWLTIHVLTIVSSYAAFALAMGLGMVAVGYYLAATYRRPARFGALVTPLVPGLMLLVSGWLASDTHYYVAWGAAGIGGVLTIMSTFAMIGEAANRAPIRTLKAGLAGLGVGLVGLIAALAGPGSVVLFDGGVLCTGLGAIVAVVGLFGMASRPAVVDRPAAGNGEDPLDLASTSAPAPFATRGKPGLQRGHADKAVHRPDTSPGRGEPPSDRRAKPGDAGDGRPHQTDCTLPRPLDADRGLTRRRRDDPRRDLGRLLVGSILGLGPEGSLGPHHAAGLPRAAPRPVRRLGEHLRAGRVFGRLLRVGGDGLVRGQLRPRSGPS